MSPDNYIPMPLSPGGYNRYNYANSNPLKYIDPDGEWIQFVIGAVIGGISGWQIGKANGAKGWGMFGYIAGGAAIGAVSGGAGSAVSSVLGGGIAGAAAGGAAAGFISGAGNSWLGGGNFGQGIVGGLKGGLVGGVGGAFGTLGGGSFLNNMAFGIGGGAVTGGISAALNGNDIGQGVLFGAIAGGAFAAASSGIESYKNYKSGYGFKTDHGVVKSYTKNGRYQDAIDFVQQKYGFAVPNMTYDNTITDYGVADPKTGDILIGNAAFRSPGLLKATIVHEFGHSTIDRILDANGNFVRWKYPQGSYNTTNATLSTDGPIGYGNEILNSGNLHIGRSILRSDNPLWFEWKSQWGNRFLLTLPMRFNGKYRPFNY